MYVCMHILCMHVRVYVRGVIKNAVNVEIKKYILQ